MTKRCSRCSEIKPVADFHRNRARADGLSERCRRCKSTEDAMQRARKRALAAAEAAATIASGAVCSKCGAHKPISDFYRCDRNADKRHGGTKDGRHKQCKDCMKAASRERWALRRSGERLAITRRQSLFSVPHERRDRSYDRKPPLESDPEALRLLTVDELIAEWRQRELANVA